MHRKLFIVFLIISSIDFKWSFAQHNSNQYNDGKNVTMHVHAISHNRFYNNIMTNVKQQENANYPHEPLMEVHEKFPDDYVMYNAALPHLDSTENDYENLHPKNLQVDVESDENYRQHADFLFHESFNENLDDVIEGGRVYQPRPVDQPSSNNDPNIILVPRLGLVRGIYAHQVIKNRLISAYFGLKYGFVRPGLGRFQKASPVEKFENQIDATAEPENCPQYPDVHLIAQREKHGENVDDCLTLNIYKPAEPGSYPVLVFIHGEMLFDGSASEGRPDYFLEHEIILITVNYRLAPFGYLSTLSDAMPGNVALADIQMALEWIQQYIRAFHGNPDQVTLMGQAGGATLIHALSLSGQANGLFHKLILHSGTALNPYFLDEQPLNTVRSFAHYSRCPARRTVDGFLNCFEHMTTSDILKNFKVFRDINEARGLTLNSGYKLIIGDRLGYLPYHPFNMLANNLYPLMIGSTKDAGAFILSRLYKQLSDVRSNNVTDYISGILKHVTHPRHYQLWKNWAIQHIFNDDIKHEQTLITITHKLLELVNLVLYRGPIIDSIRFTSKKAPTFMFSFDYRGEYHRYGHLPNVLPFEIDATLSDDAVYLFPYPKEVSQLNDEDKKMARTIIHMWTQFVQYDVPRTLIDGGIIWPNVSSEYGPFLRFTNKLFENTPNIFVDYNFTDSIPVPKLYPGNGTLPTNITTTPTTTTTMHQQQLPTHSENHLISSQPQPLPYQMG